MILMGTMTMTESSTTEIVERREKARELQREAYRLLHEANDLEREERRREARERRDARVAALKENPTSGLIIISVEEQFREMSDGSMEVEEIEILHEGRHPNPVATRYADGAVHWHRNPMYLSKAGIDMTEMDRTPKKPPAPKPGTGLIRRIRSYSSR